MSLLVLAVVAAAIAFLVGKVWATTIPVVVALVVGAVILALGGSLNDTPLPFATALATIAAGSAILVRRRLTPT